ncbi:hypothetical protein EB052_00255 [bacterium]|nr:hypothetical protein [bacterium]
MNFSKFATPLKSLSLIALTLALSLAIQTHADSTWIPATASAPGGNVPTPINSGLNTQSKLGGLFLNTSATQPFDIGLSVFGKTVLNGDVIIATGSPAAGKVLTALDGNGTVGWSALGQSCTPVVTSSSISLVGNSGNNSGGLTDIGTLSAGDYVITGSGSTANSGGGGWAGVVIDASSTLDSTTEFTRLGSLYGNPVTSGTGSSYTLYYNDSDSGTIVMRKRNGYNDGTFTVPSTSFTLTGSKHLYVVLVQASISGSLTVQKTQNVCGGGSTTVSTVSCPSGTTKITSVAGKTSCIENTRRTSTDVLSDYQVCTLAGMHMCSAGQLKNACSQAPSIFPADGSSEKSGDITPDTNIQGKCTSNLDN